MSRPEHTVYARAAELLARGERFTLCRVVRAVGSAPRDAGAHLIVFPEGSIEYTLGGGALEGRVMREAALSMDDPVPAVREYHLKDLGMDCGGVVRVAFEPARPDDLGFYRAAADLIKRRVPFVAAYALSGEAPLPKALFPADGGPVGPPGFVARVRERAGEGRTGEADGAFLHAVLPPLRLLVFGAGHVGAMLARVAAATGVFGVEVVDDRPAFANAAKLPGAERVTLAPPDYEGALPLPDARTFAAVITRCHATDQVVLRRLLGAGAPFAYLGMIGSVSKRAKLFRRLRDEGVPQGALDRVTSPMGLPIGGKDPGEIAISMLAEMVQRNNELDGTLEGGPSKWKRTQPQA